MKPDKNTCLNCGKEISLRAKYCSDKCTKAYKRNSDKRSDKSNSDTENVQVGHELGQTLDFRDTLTKTDKTFYDRALRDFNGDPYYNFDGVQRKAVCGFCGAKFETRMSLLKFCSYDHYKDSLSAVVH